MGIEPMAFGLALRLSNHTHWSTEIPHLSHIQLRYHCAADNVSVAWFSGWRDPKLWIAARVRYSCNAFSTRHQIYQIRAYDFGVQLSLKKKDSISVSCFWGHFSVFFRLVERFCFLNCGILKGNPFRTGTGKSAACGVGLLAADENCFANCLSVWLVSWFDEASSCPGAVGSSSWVFFSFFVGPRLLSTPFSSDAALKADSICLADFLDRPAKSSGCRVTNSLEPGPSRTKGCYWRRVGKGLVFH